MACTFSISEFARMRMMRWSEMLSQWFRGEKVSYDETYDRKSHKERHDLNAYADIIGG